MRLSALLIPLLLLSATAQAKKKPKVDEAAQPTRPTLSATPVAVMIAGFDRDGDARVTRAEFDAGVERSFRTGDTNGDAAISLVELTNWSTMWLGNAYALPGLYDFDSEGEDDRISPAEYRAEFDRRFKALDKDSDGVLVRSELILLTMPRVDPRTGERPGRMPAKPPARN